MDLQEHKRSDAAASLTQSAACPLCANTSVTREAVRWKDGTFTLCRFCGFLYQDPLPSEQAVRSFYEKEYYDELEPLEGSIRDARHMLYEQALRQLAPLKKTGRILDVGSGFGDFLLAAKNAGWDCWGLDPSREACDEARQKLGEHIVLGTAESADFPEGYFDGITLWNVLDCVVDPSKTLRQIRRWLRPGGRVLIRTPNAASHYFFHRLYHDFQPLWNALGWKKDFTAFHQSNFSVCALSGFLKAAGFQNIEITNALMTSGDPYRIFSKKLVLNFFKKIVSLSASMLAIISGGRWIAGSTLWAWAEAPACGACPQKTAWNLSLRIPLKRTALYFFSFFGYLLGVPVWYRLWNRRTSVSILLYHSVVGGKPGEMSVSQDTFRRQIRFLKKAYEVVSLDEAVSFLRHSRRLKKPAVAITFDDGYQDNYLFAYPVLRELGVPATIFLLTGQGPGERKVDHLLGDGFYPSRLLSWQEVHEMVKNNISFGSHGESHAHLVDLKLEDLQQEIARSKRSIESETGEPVRFFSYPYGTVRDFDRRVMTQVRDAGYQAGFSAVFGVNTPQTGLYALRRISIEASDTLWTLRAKLNGALYLMRLFHSSILRRFVRWVDRVFLRRPSLARSPFSPVLLASVDFPPHTDGVSTIAGELSSRISKRRPNFFILGPSDEHDREWDEQQNYGALRVPGYDWGYARMLPFALAMPYLILRHGIRRVFALNIAYGGLISWLLFFLLRLRYVLFAYGYEFEKVRTSAILRNLYLAIYNRSEKVICCSEAVRARLHAFGVPEAKTVTIYPAVDLVRYHPASVPEKYVQRRQFSGRRIILTVGRLVERKGHDAVLRALQKLIPRYPELLYCISGKGEDELRLHKIVKDLGLEAHVRFMGRVSDQELGYLYNLCEFLLCRAVELRLAVISKVSGLFILRPMRLANR